MPQFSLDVTAHHFGQGPDGLRDYVKQWAPVNTGGPAFVEAVCRQHAAYFLTLQLTCWTKVDDDWWGVNADLRGPDGQMIGQRPALIYGKPYDVPVYTNFKVSDALFSLGIRTVNVG